MSSKNCTLPSGSTTAVPYKISTGMVHLQIVPAACHGRPRSFQAPIGLEPFLAYGFRSQAGKPIVAYWLAAHSVPGGAFPPLRADLTIANSGIRHPVLIDVVSGDIEPITKAESSDVFPNLPARDSVMAIADEDYFDWPVLPEAPSSLTATVTGNSVRLRWQTHSGDPANAIVERRAGDAGVWTRIATQPSANAEYVDGNAPAGMVCYRVRTANANGESA
jgi:hypothetical protein